VEQSEWEKLPPNKKKRKLYLKQKNMLDMFLERGAISQAQHDKSLGDLTLKMGFRDCDEKE
jgi:hypothetical protein